LKVHKSLCNHLCIHQKCPTRTGQYSTFNNNYNVFFLPSIYLCTFHLINVQYHQIWPRFPVQLFNITINIQKIS
jgi:hypothetical protein